MKPLEMLLIGSLFIGGVAAVSTGHAQDKPSFSQAQQDSVKLHDIIMPIINDYSNVYKTYPATVKPLDKERRLKIRVKKPIGSLEIELYVDKSDLFKDVCLDECTVYLIHKERSAFTIKEYSLTYLPKIKHRIKYTETKEEVNPAPQGSEILKETENIIFSTFKKVINKTTLKTMFSALDFRQFIRENYERDFAIEKGNLLVKNHVYIEEIPIFPAVDFLDLPQKKLHKICVERGEDSIDLIVVFYSLKEEKKFNFLGKKISPYSKRSEIDYAIIDLRK